MHAQTNTTVDPEMTADARHLAIELTPAVRRGISATWTTGDQL
jgi:post-segregation antitoxin (ccd killing protein)